MWTRAELKEVAKTNFKRVYKQAVIVCVIVYIIGMVVDGWQSGSTNHFKNTATYNINQNYNADGIYVEEEPNFIDKFSYENMTAGAFEGILNNINSPMQTASILVIFLIIIFTIIIIIGVRYFILNPIIIGKNNFFMGIREKDRKVSDIFFLFDKSKFIKPSVTMFFVSFYTFLWSLLLVIPGIIKSYEYLMIPYILCENPEIDRKRAFEISRHMMDGQKWEVFVLDLSFILWNLLSSITFGLVGIFYVNPYKEATFAELYAVLRENTIQENFVSENELPGFDL